MAVFSVIITSTPPASVTITAANYTYTQFKNSLGSYVYLVEKIYLNSASQEQVNQVMLFKKYDSNGNITYINLVPAVSPYQNSNAFVLETKEDNVVLDGRGRMTFTLLSNVSLQIQLITNRVSISEYLDSLAQTNYAQVEAAMGKVGLFDNYTDKIYDEGESYTIPAK